MGWHSANPWVCRCSGVRLRQSKPTRIIPNPALLTRNATFGIVARLPLGLAGLADDGGSNPVGSTWLKMGIWHNGTLRRLAGSMGEKGAGSRHCALGAQHRHGWISLRDLNRDVQN
jgi:hypothetical protein